VQRLDPERRSGDSAGVAFGPQHGERLGIADVVADEQHGGRPSVAQQPGEGVALGGRARWPQLQIPLAGEALETLVRVEPVDDRPDPAGGIGDVRRGAIPEREGRELRLDDEPRLTDLGRHRLGQGTTLGQMAVVAGVRDDRHRRRPRTPRQLPHLEAVVAEVGRAADAHPSGEVDRRAAREEHHLDAGQAGHAAERPLGERLGHGAPRIGADARDRAVEVADHEPRPQRQGPGREQTHRHASADGLAARRHGHGDALGAVDGLVGSGGGLAGSIDEPGSPDAAGASKSGICASGKMVFSPASICSGPGPP
jgi:hypothetical protein